MGLAVLHGRPSTSPVLTNHEIFLTTQECGRTWYFFSKVAIYIWQRQYSKQCSVTLPCAYPHIANMEGYLILLGHFPMCWRPPQSFNPLPYLNDFFCRITPFTNLQFPCLAQDHHQFESNSFVSLLMIGGMHDLAQVSLRSCQVALSYFVSLHTSF